MIIFNEMLSIEPILKFIESKDLRKIFFYLFKWIELTSKNMKIMFKFMNKKMKKISLT